MVVLHPADAGDAGAVDGEPVVIHSARGAMTGVAKVDVSIRRGAVSVPHGHHGATVNLLTDKDDIDTITGMVRYAGVPVTVTPT